MIFRPFLQAALAVTMSAAVLRAQSLDLMIDNTGLSIGDSRIVRGIRLNFRDRNMERVDGINATIWSAHEDAWGGDVNGAAIGLPLTGARRISGLGLGIFGVAAEEEFSGIGVGGLGVGAGGDASGILIGGFGVGAGGDVRGLTIGGFGAGAGGRVTGITIGGFGAGAGGGVTGLQVGGFGVGSGGDVRGITIAGIAAGSGGTMRGLTVAGAAAGAPRMRGIVVSSVAGGHDVYGGILAPLYFRLESEEDGDLGLFRGVSVSALNHVKGEQRGLTIGLFNYAWELRGWQVGVINCAESNRALKCLPLLNWDRRD